MKKSDKQLYLKFLSNLIEHKQINTIGSSTNTIFDNGQPSTWNHHKFYYHIDDKKVNVHIRYYDIAYMIFMDIEINDTMFINMYPLFLAKINKYLLPIITYHGYGVKNKNIELSDIIPKKYLRLQKIKKLIK